MKRLLQRLFAPEVKPAVVQRSFALPPVTEWGESEARVWRTFLESPTGKTLMLRARGLEYANAVRGAQDQFHTVHSAGRTAGITDALNWLESLASDQMISRSSGAQDENLTADREQNGTEPVEHIRHF